MTTDALTNSVSIEAMLQARDAITLILSTARLLRLTATSGWSSPNRRFLISRFAAQLSSVLIVRLAPADSHGADHRAQDRQIRPDFRGAYDGVLYWWRATLSFLKTHI